jgi:hypothetical protein
MATEGSCLYSTESILWDIAAVYSLTVQYVHNVPESFLFLLFLFRQTTAIIPSSHLRHRLKNRPKIKFFPSHLGHRLKNRQKSSFWVNPLSQRHMHYGSNHFLGKRWNGYGEIWQTWRYSPHKEKSNIYHTVHSFIELYQQYQWLMKMLNWFLLIGKILFRLQNCGLCLCMCQCYGGVTRCGSGSELDVKYGQQFQ